MEEMEVNADAVIISEAEELRIVMRGDDELNFSNVQLISSVSALLRERSDTFAPTDARVAVVSAGVSVISLRISLQLDVAAMSL